MAAKIIAIVGVTGNQGSSIANTFLKEPGWKVRGITRDVNKSNSKTLADQGVEMVQGDLDDVESMKKALRGANVIFGNTDFGQFMFDPSIQAQAREEGRNVNELATDLERVQAIKLIDAVDSTMDSLELFIFSCFSDAKGWSKGKITYNLHFDKKWDAVMHLKAEHPQLWEKTSLLQMALFMSNIWLPFYTPRKQANGTFKVRLPMRGDAKIPMIDPRADTGPLARALVHLPPKTNLVGAGEITTWNKWCTLWSKLNGVTCTFEQSTSEELEAMIGPFGREMAAAYQYIDEFGLHGGDPTAVYPSDLPMAVELTSLEKFLASQDWSIVLE